MPDNPTPQDRIPALIFDESIPDRRGADLPSPGVPESSLDELLPGVVLRSQEPRLPRVSEAQVVRHYTRLSQLNHSVDTGFYPLGSCTMKYNPKINEAMASLPGFLDLHPYQDEADVQGILDLMYGLERALVEVTGMHRANLQPAAGAHGELAGILMIKAYHADHDGSHRDTVLVPDSAHGTNLATAAMAGYKVVEVPSDPRGLVDMDALRDAVSDKTAAFMLTNPNTLGLFEEQILEISSLIHSVGGLCYYDGANLNAVMGKARPGDMGMDVVHINLHKTFSTPHGGGGPGAGPVAVTAALEPYLPTPMVDLEESRFTLDYNRPKSIGRLRAFYGNVGVLVRAYTYILRMGGNGLTQASEDAVLNANYLRVQLHDRFKVPYDRLCMHEFVISATAQAARGAGAGAIGKRILDYGIHAPTVYFPLIVSEALMIEPTETEDKATLDRFVAVMNRIDDELSEDVALVANAPHTTPVRQPDGVEAARRPVLRWVPPR